MVNSCFILFQNESDNVSRGLRSHLLPEGGEGSGSATPEDLRDMFFHDSWNEPLPGIEECLTGTTEGAAGEGQAQSSAVSSQRGRDMGDLATEPEQRKQFHNEGGSSSAFEPNAASQCPLDSDTMVQRKPQQGTVPSQKSTGGSEGPEGQLYEEEFCPASPVVGSRRARLLSVGGRSESSEPGDVPAFFDEPWVDELFRSASGECKRRLKEFRQEERRTGLECATVVVTGDVRDKFVGTRWSGTVAFHTGEPGDGGHTHITFSSPGAN